MRTQDLPLAEFGIPGRLRRVPIDDETVLVCETFRLVEAIP